MALIAHRGAVDLLLKIIETRSARMAGSVMTASFGEASVKLLGSGLIVKVGQAESVASMDDFEDEPTRVEWSPERQSYGYYGTSGRWVEVPVEELTIYGVKMPSFLTQLLLRCERSTTPEPAPIVPDILWDLGTVKLEARGKPVSVWFARRIFDSAHRSGVENMAARRPPAETRVIIAPTTRGPDIQIPDHIVVALRDVLATPGDLAIDPVILAKRLRRVPASAPKAIRHSVDYGMIHIGDEIYKFTGLQHRAILRILVDAYNSNDPVRLTADVLEEVGAGPRVTNLARAFSGNKHWHKFIKEQAGQCWIATGTPNLLDRGT